MADHVGLRETKRIAGATLAVGWFVILFVITVGVSAVTLSASQLQSRLYGLSQEDTPMSVWQVQRIREAWNTQQAEIASLQLSVKAKRDEWTAADAKYRETWQRHQSSLGQCGQAWDDLNKRLAGVNADFVGVEFPGVSEQLPLTAFLKNSQAIRSNLADGGVDEAIRNLEERLSQAWQTSRKLFDESVSLDNIAFTAKGLLDREQDALNLSQAKLDQIIDPENQLERPDRVRISDLISEFAFMETFALGALYYFAVLPSEFLIIVLVVTMGILGSTLQLTYLYYRDGGIGQIGQFFVRPMLGAITAIVVFVLLKAGVLVVTDSAKLGEVAPLNPFFISFVGIVSGLMSENALESIRSVGQSWFRGSGSAFAARWARGIAAEISEERSVEKLAAAADVPVEEAQKWVDETKPVPADQQRVVAAFFGKDKRTLFTDMPPEEQPG